MERFDGNPMPSEEVLDIIGQLGVNYIHNTLKLFRDTKRQIYGTSDIRVYFDKEQYFKVVGQPYTIKVISLGDDSGNYDLIISSWDATLYKRKKEVIRSLQTPICS